MCFESQYHKVTNQGGIQFVYYEWKRKAAIILVFPLDPLIHQLHVSFAFRAFSGARQGAQFPRALSRVRRRLARIHARARARVSVRDDGGGQ